MVEYFLVLGSFALLFSILSLFCDFFFNSMKFLSDICYLSSKFKFCWTEMMTLNVLVNSISIFEFFNLLTYSFLASSCLKLSFLSGFVPTEFSWGYSMCVFVGGLVSPVYVYIFTLIFFMAIIFIYLSSILNIHLNVIDTELFHFFINFPSFAIFSELSKTKKHSHEMYSSYAPAVVKLYENQSVSPKPS